MQKIFMALTYAVLLLATSSGCSLLTNQLDDAAKGAGKLVTFYCENVTVPEIREEFRAAVNSHAAPHSVSVACAQGGPVLRTAPAAPVQPES